MLHQVGVFLSSQVSQISHGAASSSACSVSSCTLNIRVSCVHTAIIPSDICPILPLPAPFYRPFNAFSIFQSCGTKLEKFPYDHTCYTERERERFIGRFDSSSNFARSIASTVCAWARACRCSRSAHDFRNSRNEAVIAGGIDQTDRKVRAK